MRAETVHSPTVSVPSSQQLPWSLLYGFRDPVLQLLEVD